MDFEPVVAAIELNDPIEKNGKVILSKLEFRKACAGDMADLPEEPGFKDMLIILSKVTRQPRGLIDKLSIPDVKRAFEEIKKLFGIGED